MNHTLLFNNLLVRVVAPGNVETPSIVLRVAKKYVVYWRA
jgi:hypothetical protein